jgi:predicted ATPase with chaperone activity
MAAAPAVETGPHTAWQPRSPETLEDAGLSAEFVEELLLKVLYVHGARSGQQLIDTVRLPFPFVDSQLLDMQQRRFVEVRSAAGASRGSYVFDLTGTGRERAREAFAGSRYVGPAPVPLAQYRQAVAQQSIGKAHVTRDAMRKGFEGLVLDPAMLDVLGPAINSAKSLFLFGDAGNGKTLIAETIASLLGGELYLPFAVELDGEIMVLVDPTYHRSAAGTPAGDDPMEALWLDSASTDRRYARVARPVVLTGGELTLDQLDLQYDAYTKLYQAPFQVKANGGVLIIDDFGRQRVPPRDLLNRWIVPLERREDYLTLHTGAKFSIPFDCLVIFATNLDPKSLVEEAFLRRIHYKVQVEDPDRAEYEEIFRRCCAARGIPFDGLALEFIYREYYGRLGLSPRSCHPRDLTDHVLDIAKFLGVPPALSVDLLEHACHSYFLDTSHRRPTREAR